MNKSSKAGKIIAILFVLLVVPFAIYGFLTQVKNNSTEIESFKSEMLEPYVESIKTGDFDKAYNDYTTDSYKERTSFEEFVKGQERNKAEYGNLEDIYAEVDIFSELIEPDKGKFYRVTLIYDAENKDAVIVYELRDVNGTYKLDVSYDKQVPLDILKERVY